MMNNVGLIWSNLSEPEIDTLSVDVRDSEYINFQNGPLVCSLFMHDLMHLCSIHSPAVSVFLDFVHYWMHFSIHRSSALFGDSRLIAFSLFGFLVIVSAPLRAPKTMTKCHKNGTLHCLLCKSRGQRKFDVFDEASTSALSPRSLQLLNLKIKNACWRWWDVTQ